jgi:hypothetical protein
MMQLEPRSLTSGRKIYYRGPLPRIEPVEPAPAFAHCMPELACHEAAHAIVTLAVGQPLYAVEINPKTGQGFSYSRPPAPGLTLASEMRNFDAICRDWQREGNARDSEQFIIAEATVLAAGGVAQSLFNPDADARVWETDTKKIALLAGLIRDTPEGVREFIEQRQRRARELCLQYSTAIAQVTAGLVEKLWLDGDEVRAIFYEHKKTSSPLRGIAAHEAAHAVARLVLGKLLGGVRIFPETKSGETVGAAPPDFPGASSNLASIAKICGHWAAAGPDRATARWIADEMAVLYAGPYAQAAEDPESSRDWGNDIAKINLLAGVFGDGADAFRQRQLDRAVEIVSKHRAEIERIAEGLIERNELSGDQVRSIVASFRQSRAVDTGGEIRRRDCMLSLAQ